jgi:hypothetical protein
MNDYLGSKSDTRWINIFGILFFFSSIINYYFLPTFFLTEAFVLLVILRGVLKKTLVKEDFFSCFFLCLFSFILIVYGYLLPKNELDSFAKESYRFLFIPFMVLPYYFLRPDYKKVFRLILICCRIYMIYNLYEVIYINLIDPGGVQNTIFGNAIYAFFKTDESSAYFLPQGEFLIPFIRPFGLWLQPQKSAFIFPIAIIIEYVYRRDFDKTVRSNLWYVLFIISSLLTGGKTALITSVLLVYILNVKFFRERISIKQFWFLLASLCLLLVVSVIVWSFSQSEHGSASAMATEVNALFGLPISSILFGVGFLNNADFMEKGFTGESFLIRIISQIGIVFYTIYSFLFAFSIVKKIDKLNILVLIVLFYMMLHYAIINVYYFTNIICLLFYYNNTKNNEQRNSIT